MLNKNRPPVRPFAHLQCHLVSEVQCFLDGATSVNGKAAATVTVQHSGLSCLHNDQSDSVWTFVHAPRTVTFEYRITDSTYREGQGDLTDDEQYMMSSPFAVWAVRVRPEGGMNNQLDMSKLKKVTLTFRGRGTVSPIFTSA